MYVNIIKSNTSPRHVIEENREGYMNSSYFYIYFILAVRCRKDNDCANGGTCLDAYHCLCSAGFTGHNCEASKHITSLIDQNCNSGYNGLFISDSV